MTEPAATVEQEPEEEVVAATEHIRRKRTSKAEEREGRVARSPGGADFLARLRKIGYEGKKKR